MSEMRIGAWVLREWDRVGDNEVVVQVVIEKRDWLPDRFQIVWKHDKRQHQCSELARNGLIIKRGSFGWALWGYGANGLTNLGYVDKCQMVGCRWTASEEEGDG